MDAGDIVDVSGQAVHVQSLAVLGGSHQLFGAAPVHVLLVLLQQLQLQSLNASHVAVAVQDGTLLHCCEGSPGLGVNDVSILECLSHGVGLGEGTAGQLSVLLSNLFDLGHDLVALGMSQDDVHAEAGHQANDTLGNGQGLAVGGRVCPSHSNLLALQVLDAAELVDDVQSVSHSLGGVVDVTLQVDQSGLLLQDASCVTLGNSVHELLLVGVALADVHVVTDTDDVSHEGNHVSGLTDGLAMSNLRLAFVQILNFQAQQVTCRSEGETGTGGVVAEQGDAQAGLEDLGGDVVLTHVAQSVSDGEDSFQLVLSLVPGQVEVAVVHLSEVQGVQLVNILLQGLVHFK